MVDFSGGINKANDKRDIERLLVSQSLLEVQPNIDYQKTTTDLEFDLVFKVENLKFMSNDYTVRVSSKGISHFSSEKGKLQYFIATESR